MPVSISGTNGVTFPDSSLQAAAASPYTLKNKIINGDFRIDQRNAGASVTPINAQYTLDRWKSSVTAASKYSVQQNAGSVTPPTGFSNYLGITSLSSYSVVSGDAFGVYQLIEGFNTADLAWGTANARTVTLSFWVRSSLTGTFSGVIQNNGSNRSYPFTYTISAANTWEQKSITIAGDTTGTWVGATNGLGMWVYFNIGVGSTYAGTANTWSGSALYGSTGSTSVVGTNGATFYITGVQLEQNTSATPFERRLYGQELINCQRYLPAVNSNGTSDTIITGQPSSTTAFYAYFPFLVTPRVPPTGLSVSAASHFTCPPFVGSNGTATAVAISGSSYKLARVFFTTNTMTSTTAGAAGDVFFNNASGQLLFTGCEI
jgi:hypothetical protein